MDNEARTFTQDELDQIVQDRLARDRKATGRFTQHQVDQIVSERLARANVPTDYEDLKTEAARLADAAERHALELQAAAEQVQSLEARAKDATLDAAIYKEAARLKIADPETALTLLDRDGIEVDGEGHPQGVTEAVETLAREKPWLRGIASLSSVDQGARTSTATSESWALDLMERDPATFDRLVAAGQIPKDIFGQ